MLKKLMFCVLIGGFCTLIGPAPETQAQDNWYARASGGIHFTGKQIEAGEVMGTAQFSFLRLVYKDQLAVGGSFWNVKNAGENIEDYSGKVYFFTRNAKKKRDQFDVGTGAGLWEKNKFQVYLFTGAGLTHDGKNGEGKFGEASYNGGFGLLIPVGEFTPFLEFGASQLIDDWIFSLTAGWQIGLDL